MAASSPAWSSEAARSTTRSRINPAEARSRFAEAHDLVIKAWTEPGPFEFIGKHYRIRYVNTWPRPVQQPHPEVWIPGAGSLETVEFVAKHRYAYMGIPYFHISVFERMFRLMREACENEGYEADPLQLGWLVPIFVAETDAEARKRFEEHFWYFVKRLLPGISISPPGYTSIRSVENIIKGGHTFAGISSRGTRWSKVSTPSWARPRRWLRSSPRTSSAWVSATCSGSSSSARLVPTTLAATFELFAAEVAPKLRARFPGTERRVIAGRAASAGGASSQADMSGAVA